MDEKDEENDETSSIIKHASKPPISSSSFPRFLDFPLNLN